jgi:hypothetical protein
MGEAKRKRSATQRLIAQFPDCCFCGGLRRSVTREHMPPLSLFDRSHRPDDLVMPACDECNRGTSTSDLVVAMISRWQYDSTPQEQIDHAKLSQRVKSHAPELVAEWLTISPWDKIRARQHLLDRGVQVPQDAEIATAGPLTTGQLNLFAHKAALALYFQHFQKPLPNTGSLCAFWRTKEDFSRGIPQELLDLLPGYGTLRQGQWSESKTFEYRHAMNFEDGTFGCLARFRYGFFVYGFAISNIALLPQIEQQKDWIKPLDLLNIPKLLQKRP